MKEISTIDIKHLEIIRSSVRSVILEASKIDHETLTVLDIAPQIHQGAREFFKKAKIMTLDIDPNSGATFIADICKNNSDILPNEYFDLILCTEVLEHTLFPFNAVSEIQRILKPGGVCYTTTPFNFRIHGPLPDCWRFTEYGLKVLFRDFSNVSIKQIEAENRFLMPIHYITTAIK